MYRLVFLNGPDKGKRLAIREPLITVGRDPDCFLRLADDEVSRQHAIIEQRADGVYLKDLDATNPTLVNDAPVREIRLKNGDRIEFGSTLLQFQTVADSVDSQSRRTSRIEGIATAAVVVILLVELGLLAYLVTRHREVTGQHAVATADRPTTDVISASRETAFPTTVVEERSATPEVPGEPSQTPDLTASAAADADNAATDELESLRAEVEELKKQVEGLADTSTRPLVALEPPTQAEPVAASRDEDVVLVRAQAMLRQAAAEIARMNYVAADELLQRIQIMAPDFLPAYVERAKLFEQRGMLKAAGDQWAEVLNRSIGTPLYEQAAAERIRLARLATAQPARDAASELRSEKSDRLPRRIRIMDVQQERFPKDEQFDEMRLLRVTLKPRPGERDLDPYNVTVQVTFFDENTETQQVRPTRAVVSKTLPIEGTWREGEPKTISATYIVPQGFRDQEYAQYGERMLYYGYVVRVYYRGQLQDVEARPRSLIQQLSQIPSPVHKP